MDSNILLFSTNQCSELLSAVAYLRIACKEQIKADAASLADCHHDRRGAIEWVYPPRLSLPSLAPLDPRSRYINANLLDIIAIIPESAFPCNLLVDDS